MRGRIILGVQNSFKIQTNSGGSSSHFNIGPESDWGEEWCGLRLSQHVTWFNFCIYCHTAVNSCSTFEICMLFDSGAMILWLQQYSTLEENTALWRSETVQESFKVNCRIFFEEIWSSQALTPVCERFVRPSFGFCFFTHFYLGEQGFIALLVSCERGCYIFHFCSHALLGWFRHKNIRKGLAEGLRGV